MTKQAAICCAIQTFVLICWINLSNCPYLSICTCVSRTERVAGVISGYVFLRRFFYLTCPRPLHAMGRHQDPGVSERVITEVLMLWRQGNVIIHTIRVIVLVWERKWHWNLNHVNVHRSQPDEQVLYVFKKVIHKMKKGVSYITWAAHHNTVTHPKAFRQIWLQDICGLQAWLLFAVTAGTHVTRLHGCLCSLWSNDHSVNAGVTN